MSYTCMVSYSIHRAITKSKGSFDCTHLVGEKLNAHLWNIIHISYSDVHKLVLWNVSFSLYSYLIFLMANSSSHICGLMYINKSRVYKLYMHNVFVYNFWKFIFNDFFVRRDLTTLSSTRHLIRMKILSRWSIHTSSHQKL